MFAFDITLNSVVMAVSAARGPPMGWYKNTFKCVIFVGEQKNSFTDLPCLVLVLIFSMTERMTKCITNWSFLLRPIRPQNSRCGCQSCLVKGRIIYTRRKVAGQRSLSGGLGKFLINKGSLLKGMQRSFFLFFHSQAPVSFSLG